MEQYLVEFDNVRKVMDEDELIKFVTVAVVRNKDIASFTASRIEDVYVNEYGKAEYVLADSHVFAAQDAFFNTFNL